MTEYKNIVKENVTSSLKDFVNIIRRNSGAVFIITFSCMCVSGLYALNSKDIFKSTTSIKVNKPQGSILEAPMLPEFQEFGSDRFIANEMEILKSYSIAERVAKALIDSSGNYDIDSFYLIIDNELPGGNEHKKVLTVDKIIEIFQEKVSIEQRRGLDIIEVSVESISSFESALIGNCFANEYRNLNLEINRNHLTIVKEFLFVQKVEKLGQLNKAEQELRAFQENGGIIALDLQSSLLINQVSSFEAEKNAVQIELTATAKVLDELKTELNKQNPRLADYLSSISSEVYFKSLQEQIARLELNRDIAIANKNSKINNPDLNADYEKRIIDLKEKLEEKIKVVKAGIFASSPDEIKELSKKIIEEEIKFHSLTISLKELKRIVDQYDKEFNKLPRAAIELAGYQRNRESLEKLYVLVEEKFQQALINEQSQPGSVYIIDKARRTTKPDKPNRYLIVVVGFILGSGISFGYIFLRKSFDTTIKNPEDIKGEDINVLAWIPKIDGLGLDGNNDCEFIVSRKPDSVASEAFRALRTRIRYSKIKSLKLITLLVTSSAPQEGKTSISINLASAFAQSHIKTLLIDCDLRKPRIHSIFKMDKCPGLVDYLSGSIPLTDVIRRSSEENLDIITSGAGPANPAEILESMEMSNFLKLIRQKYEIIIIDSAPVIPVADTEILVKHIDASLLVVSAETTETDLMRKSVELLQNENSTFIGTVLNNFSYKAGYASYYKYYYYYSTPLKKESIAGNLPVKLKNTDK